MHRQSVLNIAQLFAAAVVLHGCVGECPDSERCCQPAPGAQEELKVMVISAPPAWTSSRFEFESRAGAAALGGEPMECELRLCRDGALVADTAFFITRELTLLDLRRFQGLEVEGLTADLWVAQQGAYRLSREGVAQLPAVLRPLMTAAKEAWTASLTIGDAIPEVNLEHAVAAIELEATDVEAFVGSSAKGEAVKVSIHYASMMPSAFDIRRNCAVEAEPWPAVERTEVMRSDAATQLIGGDMIFINEETQHVRFTVRISALNDTLLAQTPVLEVPVARGHTTRVSGAFLTTFASAGISISPTFNGDFNYVVE